MKLRRASVALLIAAGASLLSHGLTTIQFFEGLFGQLEYKTIDYRTRSSIVTQRDSMAVVLVLFDSASIAEWPYLSPYPRASLATLIDGIAASGAKAIGLDVYLDRQYPALNALDSGDVKLRDAIARAGNVVLVGPTAGSDTVRRWQPPDPYFAEHAAAVATADLPTPFETIRDGVLTVRTDAGLLPSFALALYAEALNLDVDSLLTSAGQNGRLDVAELPPKYARLGEHDVFQTVPILFEGPPSRAGFDDGAFTAIPSFGVQELIRAGLPLPWSLEGKIVILGSGFHDSERFRSPFYDVRDSAGVIYGWTYGPEVHANALQNLLSSRFATPLAGGWTLLLMLGLGGIVGLITFWRGAKWGSGAGLLLIAAELVIAWIVFQNDGLIVPMVGPILSMVLVYVASTGYVSIVEGREKRMIKGAFGKYLAPAVVEELMTDPSRLKLGGDRRHISILFSDLAGFTSMSEAINAEQLVAVLNQYLHEMAELVKEESGYVDKYIGDAIMALYGAPNAVPDHAHRVCRTAVLMQRRLEELNGIWRARDASWPHLKVRIGINTGDPVVGNIGGEDKIQYTALGDSVNLAARLEPACKVYGIGVMIAQPTREEAGDAIQVRELDLLAVYGKKEPMRVYELLGMKEDVLPEHRREALEHYTQGLEAFRRRDFELALQYFRAAIELDPDDGPSALYVDRCEDYMVNPPPADWDFVERRQVK